MKFETILFMLLTSALLVQSDHLILGDASKKQLIYHTTTQYHSIPLTKRVKHVFYNNPDQKPINAIMAYDNLHSSATATITAGGLGYTYVNLRLKSERGNALDYDIGTELYRNVKGQIVSAVRCNTECGVTSEANWRRQHAFSVDSDAAPADSGRIGSTALIDKKTDVGAKLTELQFEIPDSTFDWNQETVRVR